MKSTVTFYGGAGTVTGANFLLDTGDKKILVDCGSLEAADSVTARGFSHAEALAQKISAREHACDTVNAAPFAYDTKAIDALIVTHAHADHIGRIPRLVRAGYARPIYSTAATRDLARVMFEDALGVMRRHAERHGCDVLYESEHIEQALALWHTHEYHEAFSIGDAAVEFLDAGHILGSALAKISRAGRSIMFTGDLGNTPEPLLMDTESPSGVQYLVMESVYGDRAHEGREERADALRGMIEETRAAGGVLLIPSFSIERTQIILFELNTMIEDGSMRPIPVYLDAPLATKVTDIFRRYPQLFNADAQKHFADGKDPFTFTGLSVTVNTGESRAIHATHDPKIIIAGAGMSGGGRVRAHEQYYLESEKTTLLFVGYQAPGTLGRRLLDGEKHIQIDGTPVTVRARIAQLTGYSGHADRDQLLTFIENCGESLERVFITMGEPKSSLFLAQRAKDFLGVDARVPESGETLSIDL